MKTNRRNSYENYTDIKNHEIIEDCLKTLSQTENPISDLIINANLIRYETTLKYTDLQYNSALRDLKKRFRIECSEDKLIIIVPRRKTLSFFNYGIIFFICGIIYSLIRIYLHYFNIYFILEKVLIFIYARTS